MSLLRLTFTGVCAFIVRADRSIRVVLLDLDKNDNIGGYPVPAHMPYGRFKDHAGKANKPIKQFKRPKPGVDHGSIPLKRDGLFLDAGDIADTPLGVHPSFGQLVVSMSGLASGPMNPAYDQPSPGPGVAAQFDLTHGRVRAGGDKIHEWKFQPGGPAGPVTSCLAHGVLWEVKLKDGL